MRKRKRHTALIAITAALAVAAGVLFLNRGVILQEAKARVAVEIGKKLLEGQVGKNVNVGGQEIDVSEIVSHMDKGDVEAISDIAEKYISPSNMKQAAEMAAKGDVEGLKSLAESQLTEEDKDTLEGLYEKYKDQIP